MAVYKRTYRGYEGPLTNRGPRFLILTRFSYGRLFQSQLMLLFLAICLFYPFLCLMFIYLRHSPAFFTQFGLESFLSVGIDGRFFYFYSFIQGALAYLLTAFLGPGLISPDLANGAMPLYFCRPFSRLEYASGKACVLLALLSFITWVPGLFLFVIQTSVGGWSWGWTHLWLAGSIFIGLLAWIVVLCLLALALSAWVKWKLAAGAMILGLLFAGAGAATAINLVMRTTYGSLIDISQVIHTVWSDLFRYDTGTDMTLGQAWTVLGIVCAICIWMLARRIRAFEVIK